jgi:aspartate dehydrogenase
MQKVAIAGLGAIGLAVAKALDDGIDGLRLVAVSARNSAKAQANMADFANPVDLVALSDLAASADIVVEATPAALFREVAVPAIEAGCLFIPLSVGALLQNMDLVERAKQTGARIIAPTGALIGLDAVRAAAEGTIYSLSIETRKPPRGLKGAPKIVELGLDMDSLQAPVKVFEGSAREAIKGFPANVNVAVALSLAGTGPDNTEVLIWADPGVERNTHTIRLDSDATRFSITIEGIPSEENPATGKLTPLSAIATLRGLTATLKVGT